MLHAEAKGAEEMGLGKGVGFESHLRQLWPSGGGGPVSCAIGWHRVRRILSMGMVAAVWLSGAVWPALGAYVFECVVVAAADQHHVYGGCRVSELGQV